MPNVPLSVYKSLTKDDIVMQRKKLYEEWENFLVSSSQSQNRFTTFSIRDRVLESWERSKGFKDLDPMNNGSMKNVPDVKLKELIKNNELYQIAHPIIKKMQQELSFNNYVLMLCDENGVILECYGAFNLMRHADRTNSIKGADWSERWAGTNAIGTSIVLQQPIQIFSSEHFAFGCHDWVCSSAPIVNPVTNGLIGAINLSKRTEDFDPLSMMRTIELANQIEREIFQHYYKAREKLYSIYIEAVRKWKRQTVILIDAKGNISRINGNLPVHEIEKAVSTSLQSHTEDLKEWEDEINVSDTKYHSRYKKIFWFGQFIGLIAILENKSTIIHSNTERKYMAKYSFQSLIGEADTFKRMIHVAKVASVSDSNVLITGESGTGKELVASAIHNASDRGEQPFIAVNCAAIPKELITSELFGYVPGTFTGANPKGSKGKFELAHKGTIFLDEIGDMPLELQVQLLRVIQEQEITKMGDSTPIPIDVKIIAATNKNLLKEIAVGNFRADLYYRLNVIPIEMPSLSERIEDIPLLVQYMLQIMAAKRNREPYRITADAIETLQSHSWPGNIRELKNVIEFAVNFTEDGVIRLDNLPGNIRTIRSPELLIKDTRKSNPAQQAELEWILSTLKQYNNNISEAGKKLKMSRSTVYRKLKNLGYDVKNLN